MQVEVTIESGIKLKNVNWQHGNLKPYAVLWIDSGPKFTTKVDVEHDENPTWDETILITLPPTSHPDKAILYVDIIHANASSDIKPLVGSGQLELQDIIKLARLVTTGKMTRILQLKRPSGRPHGRLQIKLEVKDQMAGQPAYYGYGAPPPQQPAYQYPYNSPATRPAPPPQQPPYQYPHHAPPAGYPTAYGYGRPPPVHAQANRGVYIPASPKRETKKAQQGGIGSVVGAASALFGGLKIAEKMGANLNNM